MDDQTTAYKKELFLGMVRASGMPTTNEEMRTKWEELNEAEHTLIRNDSFFSPFWRLITAIVTSPARWLVRLLVEEALPNAFLRFATGIYLDIWAWAVDVRRKGATKAQGRIIFTRQHTGGVTHIPQGTVIQTPPINGEIFQVITVEDATILVGSATAQVQVEAVDAGAAYNLGAGYYSILPRTINGVTDVTNAADWLKTPGTDEEADEPLRYRCRNQFSAVGQLHHDAAYAALISERFGLRVDYLYFEKDGPRGPGTANCHIMIESGSPPVELCEEINSFIMESGNHGHGDDLVCMPVREIPLDLVVTLHPLPEAGVERREALKKEAEDRIRSAFRQNMAYSMTKTLPLRRFSFSRLGDELHSALLDLESVEFHRGEDIPPQLGIPVLASLTVDFSTGGSYGR